MARYIDAEPLLKTIEWAGDNRAYGVEKIIWELIGGIVRVSPTADVQEAKHGKWQMKPLFNSHLDESDVAVMVRCSGCGMKLIAQKCGPFPNYCANCGAKNDAERGDDVQK